MKFDHLLQRDSTGLCVATEGNSEVVVEVSTHFAVQKMASSMCEIIG